MAEVRINVSGRHGSFDLYVEESDLTREDLLPRIERLVASYAAYLPQEVAA